MIVPVIYYHKIDTPQPGSRVRGGYTPPRRFARQMAHLKRRGFDFYTASELVEWYSERGAFPPRSVVVTFDDGWKDNYTNAFPILRRLGVRATIFVVPSVVGRVTARVQADGEGPRAHLSREEILEMSAWGIEFGSHSLSHRLLHQLAPAEVKTEVEESKRQVEELTGKPCKVFAYPAGFYTDDARRLIREAGYAAAFTTHYGPDAPPDLYALNRTEILRRDRFTFQFARKVAPLLAADAPGTID